jgi:hypothetical protein
LEKNLPALSTEASINLNLLVAMSTILAASAISPSTRATAAQLTGFGFWSSHLPTALHSKPKRGSVADLRK